MFPSVEAELTVNPNVPKTCAHTAEQVHTQLPAFIPVRLVLAFLHPFIIYAHCRLVPEREGISFAFLDQPFNQDESLLLRSPHEQRLSVLGVGFLHVAMRVDTT